MTIGLVGILFWIWFSGGVVDREIVAIDTCNGQASGLVYKFDSVDEANAFIGAVREGRKSEVNVTILSGFDQEMLQEGIIEENG